MLHCFARRSQFPSLMSDPLSITMEQMAHASVALPPTSRMTARPSRTASWRVSSFGAKKIPLASGRGYAVRVTRSRMDNNAHPARSGLCMHIIGTKHDSSCASWSTRRFETDSA